MCTKLLWAALGVVSLFTLANGMVSDGRVGYGLIGYGIDMYKPPCAYACKSSITAPLNCTDDQMDNDHDMPMRLRRRHGMGDDEASDLPSGDGWMVMAPTPACLANNDFFLQTLAWCISNRCLDIDVSVLEGYWKSNVAGRLIVQPLPKVSYQQALARVTEPPAQMVNNSEHLNFTGVVDDETFQTKWNDNIVFEGSEVTHETYGLVLFITGAVIPIGLSLLRLLPLPARWISQFDGLFIDPPAFGRHHALPVMGLAIVPTRGQMLFIGYIIMINVVLSATGYVSIQPNMFGTQDHEIATYIANRVGVLSFANLPLLVLYAGRNNVLLWLTDWTHSTFLLVHRWVAFLCAIQAALHSAMYLYFYTKWDGYDHAAESVTPFWYWGIIGTLALCILLPASLLPIRKAMYEFFLASHIILSILALIGCYLHIFYRFQHQWGYETWVYMAAAIWGFDRVLRWLRLARNGIKRAFVSVINDDYVRIHIPGIQASGHVYVHFPTLSWRLWENHPFSVMGVAGTPRLPTGSHSQAELGGKSLLSDEKAVPAAASSAKQTSSRSSSLQTPRPYSSPGITLLLRRMTGLTSQLTAKAASSAGLPVLIESSYGTTSMTFLHNRHITPCLDYPNILYIAGGVGITAIMPALQHSYTLGSAVGTRKLFWGVRTRALVDTVEEQLSEGCVTSTSALSRNWDGVEVHVSVGERMMLRQILETELGARGTTVVMCGPAGMADEVRCIVAGMARAGAAVQLVEESFSW